MSEDLFEVPAAWQRFVLPRGGVGQPVAKTRAAEADRLLRSSRAAVLGSVEHPATALDLATAGRAYLDGDPAAPPLGAAVVALAFGKQLPWHEFGKLAVFADHWCARGGPDFAAAAAVEMAGLSSAEHGAGQPVHRAGSGDHAADFAVLAARRLRRLVGGVAGDALAALRGRALVVDALTSFLAPGRADWVAADCAAVLAAPGLPGTAADLLMCAVTEPPMAIELAARVSSYGLFRQPEGVYTMVASVGPAIAPAFGPWLDEDYLASEDRRRLLGILAVLPCDEAFTVLLERVGTPVVRGFLLEVAGRFPRRALRLLAAAGQTPPELLRGQVSRHPELVAAVLPELDPAAARRLTATVDEIEASRVPEAASEDVPVVVRTAAAGSSGIPLPDWADPVLLPQIRLSGGRGALPRDAVRQVMTMLAAPDPGLAGLAAEVAPGELPAFAWALFEQWRAVGSPAAQAWILQALGRVGDDDTVRRLTPVIRAWPGEGGHARAVAGLDVLAAIGTDVALMYLHGVSQKVKFKGLRERARQKIDELAAARGLTAAELADRLVPDLGLEPDGSLVLDYGRRSFVVGFDEQLRPTVADGSGKRLKALPKPGVQDDSELAPAAWARFAGLKKDVRALAGDQIHRLEQAMVHGQRWTVADFRRFFVEHPLVWHLSRRLVWLRSAESGTGFRLAEDRSFADVHDEPVALGEDELVGVAHPLHLGSSVAGWQEVFADYEILQPFPQLGRTVHALPLPDGVIGATVPTGRLLGLERRGWRRGAPQDAGMQGWLERDVPGDRVLIVEIDPGVAMGMVGEFPDQKIRDVWVDERGGHGRRFRRDRVTGLDSLDGITVSEVLRDLGEVVS